MSSLCIPRVDSQVPMSYIKEKINNLNIGHIREIREIPLRNDPTKKRILMRFYWKEDNTKSYQIQKYMEDLGSLKIVYDMPWYWKIVACQH